MEELSKYEEALVQYIKQSKNLVTPLMSWDVHMSNFSVQNLKHKDAVELQKITDKLHTEVNVVQELLGNDAVIIVTDTNLNIKFVSNNMFKMSGYLPAEVIGKTPKMFQGPDTNQKIAKQIREKVSNQSIFEAVLKNYKKNKDTYDCYIKGYPVFDKHGKLVNYIAVEHAA